MILPLEATPEVIPLTAKWKTVVVPAGIRELQASAVIGAHGIKAAAGRESQMLRGDGIVNVLLSARDAATAVCGKAGAN